MNSSCLVVGAGIYGVTAALALAQRKHKVTLIDPGPIPHPNASSTDISKVIRADYGSDLLYTELMERALEGWHDWNQKWSRPYYHHEGFLLLTRSPMQPGEFEFDSYKTLTSRGHRLERMNTDILRSRYPIWGHGDYVDGYFNANGGWAESGLIVSLLLEEARSLGIHIVESFSVQGIEIGEHRAHGVFDERGRRLKADHVVLCAGAWTPGLVPELSRLMVPVAQPVVIIRPERPDLFAPPHFITWAAEISRTGFYGFPIQKDGLVKIANHGLGRPLNPNDERSMSEAEESLIMSFIHKSFSEHSNSTIATKRLCLYCDSADGDFLIDRHPNVEGLVVAAGGSGHGFKFAPVLGDLIANAVEGKETLERFRWRSEVHPRYESARYVDDQRE